MSVMPPYGATKDELIAHMEEVVVQRQIEGALARQRHEQAMLAWRANIHERLLALIPSLEKGTCYEGSRLNAPRLEDDSFSEQFWRDRIVTLQALPDGVVPVEIRRALMLHDFRVETP